MATTSSQGEMEIFQTCGKQDRVSNKFSWKQIINTTSQYTFLRETCRMSLLRKEKQASKYEKYGKFALSAENKLVTFLPAARVHVVTSLNGTNC